MSGTGRLFSKSQLRGWPSCSRSFRQQEKHLLITLRLLHDVIYSARSTYRCDTLQAYMVLMYPVAMSEFHVVCICIAALDSGHCHPSPYPYTTSPIRVGCFSPCSSAISTARVVRVHHLLSLPQIYNSANALKANMSPKLILKPTLSCTALRKSMPLT